ncbi:putative amidohydrolase YtcJ [Fusarium oxysporum f. sp. albedinis]|nr:putative amidohydrolase YtcJ [Fusarium oxysporum f. sp. albedinis]
MLVSVLQDLPLSYGSRHISCDCDDCDWQQVVSQMYYLQLRSVADSLYHYIELSGSRHAYNYCILKVKTTHRIETTTYTPSPRFSNIA